MKISILICTWGDAEYLPFTLSSITASLPKSKYDFEILIDYEKERTGLLNTTKRYMKLFDRSEGEIIIKSDDDVHYFPGFFEDCLEAIQNDKKIAYLSPISHQLMIRLGVKHADSPDFPIKSTKLNYESPLSGMCWIFYRELWKKYPYTVCKNWQLDSEYSNFINSKGLVTASLYGAMIKHLGKDRFKAIKTDRPGKLPSKQFAKEHNIDTKIY